MKGYANKVRNGVLKMLQVTEAWHGLTTIFGDRTKDLPEPMQFMEQFKARLDLMDAGMRRAELCASFVAELIGPTVIRFRLEDAPASAIIIPAGNHALRVVAIATRTNERGIQPFLAKHNRVG